jgi:Cyclic nucleotide-binding domain
LASAYGRGTTMWVMAVIFFWLRWLAIAALSLEALYLYAAGEKPMWIGVMWSFVFVIINLMQLALIYAERSRSQLSTSEAALRESLFPLLGNVDFHYLLQSAKKQYHPSGTPLARKGEKLALLHAIIEGEAQVMVNGVEVAVLRSGSLVGEVSFFQDDVATADVLAKGELFVLSMQSAQLRRLMKKRSSFKEGMHLSIAKDMGFKMTDSTPRGCSYQASITTGK